MVCRTCLSLCSSLRAGTASFAANRRQVALTSPALPFSFLAIQSPKPFAVCVCSLEALCSVSTRFPSLSRQCLLMTCFAYSFSPSRLHFVVITPCLESFEAHFCMRICFTACLLAVRCQRAVCVWCLCSAYSMHCEHWIGCRGL